MQVGTHLVMSHDTYARFGNNKTKSVQSCQCLCEAVLTWTIVNADVWLVMRYNVSPS